MLTMKEMTEQIGPYKIEQGVLHWESALTWTEKSGFSAWRR